MFLTGGFTHPLICSGFPDGITGQATARLTDSGDTGPATVTASLAKGSKLTCVIAVEDKSDSYVISALTSDKSSIINLRTAHGRKR